MTNDVLFATRHSFFFSTTITLDLPTVAQPMQNKLSGHLRPTCLVCRGLLITHVIVQRTSVGKRVVYLVAMSISFHPVPYHDQSRRNAHKHIMTLMMNLRMADFLSNLPRTSKGGWKGKGWGIGRKRAGMESAAVRCSRSVRTGGYASQDPHR